MLWPADFHTWNMVSAYYNFERSYEYFNDIYDGEVLLVDKDTEDFVENPAVLEKICRRIDRLRNEQKR